jgi:acyl carrier protein
MTKNELIEKVKDILLIEDEVDTEYSVKIDSLASLLLIGFYDENFEFKLTAENLKQIQTIGDLINLVKEKLG